MPKATRVETANTDENEQHPEPLPRFSRRDSMAVAPKSDGLLSRRRGSLNLCRPSSQNLQSFLVAASSLLEQDEQINKSSGKNYGWITRL